MNDISTILKITDKEKQKEALKYLQDAKENDENFISKIVQKIFEEQNISDFFCRICTILNIKIEQSRFNDFWNNFIKEGIHPQNFIEGLFVISYYFEHYQNIDNNDINMDRIYSIIFYRIEKSVVEYDFDEIKEIIINCLASIASYAPLRCFLSPSLFDSITSLFMNHEETFESSVLFLWRFFHRNDAKEVLDDLIMNFIIVLSNYSPPKHSFWRFLCFFFATYSEQIENMCDFDAIEKGGVLPIFTRSLIWTIRIVVQHPPEKDDEPLFWDFCYDVLKRYNEAKDNKAQVRRLYDHIMQEIRLAICCALQVSLDKETMHLINKKALETFNLLAIINEKEIIESFPMLFGDILDITLSFCLLTTNQKLIDAAKLFAQNYEMEIKPISV